MAHQLPTVEWQLSCSMLVQKAWLLSTWKGCFYYCWWMDFYIPFWLLLPMVRWTTIWNTYIDGSL